LSASSVAAGKVSRSGLESDADAVYWTESRPEQGGRQVVVRCRRGADPVEVSPAGVSVRSRVHEYGGGQATVADGVLFYVDQTDQRWYRVPLGGSGQDGGSGELDGHPWAHRVPVALTPEGLDGSLSTRYADGRLTVSGRWLISVEEQVGPTGTVHRLVAVAASAAGSQKVVCLCDGTDFVSAPRPSPDGRWLAWTAWDHPAMPWDRSSLMIAPLVESAGTVALGPTRCISGGDDISVGQPNVRYWCNRSGHAMLTANI